MIDPVVILQRLQNAAAYITAKYLISKGENSTDYHFWKGQTEAYTVAISVLRDGNLDKTSMVIAAIEAAMEGEQRDRHPTDPEN